MRRGPWSCQGTIYFSSTIERASRPVAVSKVNQASVTPPASLASSMAMRGRERLPRMAIRVLLKSWTTPLAASRGYRVTPYPYSRLYVLLTPEPEIVDEDDGMHGARSAPRVDGVEPEAPARGRLVQGHQVGAEEILVRLDEDCMEVKGRVKAEFILSEKDREQGTGIRDQGPTTPTEEQGATP